MFSKKLIAMRADGTANLSLAERFIKDRFRSVYRIIMLYNMSFPDKPKFIFFKDGRGNVYVAREDCKLQIERTKYDLGRQVTMSEFDSMRYHWGDVSPNLPETCHTVWANSSIGVVTKLGNPFRDRAPQEFIFALQNKYFRGLVEMEVPLGFMVNMDTPDSTQEEGKSYIYMPGQKEPTYSRMYYKYINGKSLDHLLKEKKIEELNWILWEIAKIFSRLINFKILFKDPHRWNNYFIETNEHNQEVLRLLDSEFIIPKEEITWGELEHMLFGFIEAAFEVGLMDWDRIDDFLMVCLGDPNKARGIREYIRRRGRKREWTQMDFWKGGDYS